MLVALFANLAIALAKGVATVVTGSAAMAAETAHSVADTANQVFLLTALRHSRKPADAEHPLGYGRTRYFWSLLAPRVRSSSPGPCTRRTRASSHCAPAVTS